MNHAYIAHYNAQYDRYMEYRDDHLDIKASKRACAAARKRLASGKPMIKVVTMEVK